jgi:hypothetical protein
MPAKKSKKAKKNLKSAKKLEATKPLAHDSYVIIEGTTGE